MLVFEQRREAKFLGKTPRWEGERARGREPATIGSWSSKGVFSERRTTNESEAFSLLMCTDAYEFVLLSALLSFFTLKVMLHGTIRNEDF